MKRAPAPPLTESERERAKTLYASGKSVFAVARALKRSPHTIKKFLKIPEVTRLVSIQREELANMFDDVAQRSLAGVSDEDVRKASLLQKLTASGIAVDKAALLRGQATSNIDMHVLLEIASIVRGDRDTPAPPAIPALPKPANDPKP